MKHCLRISKGILPKIIVVLVFFLLPHFLIAATINDKCTIYFNDNGGSGGPGTQVITKVKWTGYVSFTLSSTQPSRTAYTFNNWLITGIGGCDLDGKIGAIVNVTVWKPGTSHEVSAFYPGLGKDVNCSVNLSAQWAPIQYTITYDGNGGTPSVSSEKYTIETAARTRTATRTGYTFTGWEVVSNNGNWYTSDNIGSTIPTGKYGNVTLRAKWTANNYTIVFNGNGNTAGSMSNQPMTYDSSASLSKNAFVRKYTVTFNANGGESNGSSDAVSSFNGWATSASGAKTYNDEQSVMNLSSASNGVVNLYANWTLGQVTLPSVTKNGYKLKGWYTSASGGTLVGQPGDGYTPTSNATLYAQWDMLTLKISETGLQGDDSAIVTVTKSGSSTPLYRVSLNSANSNVVISGINEDTYIISVAESWTMAYTVETPSYTEEITSDITVPFVFKKKSGDIPMHADANKENWKE